MSEILTKARAGGQFSGLAGREESSQNHLTACNAPCIVLRVSESNATTHGDTMTNQPFRLFTDAEYRAENAVSTCYEWAVESLTDSALGEEEGGDIDDTWHFEKPSGMLAHALTTEGFFRCCVIRDRHSNSEGLIDRQWAYLEDMRTLPAKFDGGAMVPKSIRALLLKAALRLPPMDVAR